MASRLMLCSLLFLALWCIAARIGKGHKQDATPASSSYANLLDHEGNTFESYFHVPPSVANWENIEKHGHFSVVSMSVDHHSDSSWFISSLHSKNSIGFNRTVHQRGFLDRPYACSLRFIAVGMQSTLSAFERGGTGYLTVSFEMEKKKYWHGFDFNETSKLHCYHQSNKDTGSEFLDTPRTLGLAILCPITLDDEVGPFLHRRPMENGYFCRPLAEVPTKVELHLRPSHYDDSIADASLPADSKERAQWWAKQEIVSEFSTNPSSLRRKASKALTVRDARVHAVCTVQTFMHAFSGPMLYFFVAYHQLMGWRVIVYDRFGMHREFLKDLLHLPGVDYFPFTVYQLVQPSKYNARYRDSLDNTMRTFYKMEVNWGFTSTKLADTADQDMDKTRTYDYARVEYSHLDTMLYVDADELFYCPQASESVEKQREYQQQLHDEFVSKGIEEMRYVRIPYSGLAPEGFHNNPGNRSKVDFTNHTGECMNAAYQKRSLRDMAHCWSTGTSYDNFAKSADFASVCPFHYNHWSCDGMKGGGRDATKNRCRCKVAFDMQNFYEYRPILKRCHIMHFNDNKYRFQSKRTKHVYDKGDVTIPCPLADLLSKETNTTPTISSNAPPKSIST